MRGAAPIIDILSRILKLPIAYIVIQSYSGKGIEDKQGKLMFAREISSLATDKDFKKVLLINDNNNTEVGSPTINGAIVEGLILENLKSKKVIVFKKRRRQNSRKRYGHRQPLSKVQITKILSKGGKVISEIKLSKETKPVKKVVKNKISEVKKGINKKVSLKVKSKK